MQSLKFIFILVLGVLAVACSNDGPKSQLGPAPTPIDPGSLSATPPASTGGAVAGVQHYICPNNCEGSGGAAQGNCPVCGTAYIHNQAYHGQSPAQAAATTPQPAEESSATNAAGIFHYTCPNGCAGGAGTAQACATCGTMLAHNQAYHGQAASTAAAAPQQPATTAAAPAGVFHYTCPNGCSGGADQAQACTSCGTMLAHNQAYHNTAPAASGATAAPAPGSKSPLFINNN